MSNTPEAIGNDAGRTISQRKAEVRKQIRARRGVRESPGDGAGFRAIASAQPELQRATSVTMYIPLPGEPDVDPLRAWFESRGTTVWLPIVTTVDGAPGLAWALSSDGLAHGAATPTGLRLLEPVGSRELEIAPDVVLLPGLAVSPTGLRLGQGAGYYDRTIARLGWDRGTAAGGPLLVAVVHDDEILDDVPGEAHDARADVILTPTRWIRC